MEQKKKDKPKIFKRTDESCRNIYKGKFAEGSKSLYKLAKSVIFFEKLKIKLDCLRTMTDNKIFARNNILLIFVDIF